MKIALNNPIKWKFYIAKISTCFISSILIMFLLPIELYGQYGSKFSKTEIAEWFTYENLFYELSLTQNLDGNYGSGGRIAVVSPRAIGGFYGYNGMKSDAEYSNNMNSIHKYGLVYTGRIRQANESEEDFLMMASLFVGHYTATFNELQDDLSYRNLNLSGYTFGLTQNFTFEDSGFMIHLYTSIQSGGALGWDLGIGLTF